MQERYRAMYQVHSGLSAFRRQIERATKTIEDFLGVCDRPYVAWSGGKDSEAMLILLSRISRTDVPVFTQGDDLDWPEKREFCHRITERLGFRDYSYLDSSKSALDQFAAAELDGTTEIRGTFSHVVERYILNRERNGVLIGLRSEESKGRRNLRSARGKLFQVQTGEWRCLPIADWSGIDVFGLILSEGLPYMHVYDVDELVPPHEIRCSWMVNPQFLSRGSGAWLKRHYPEQFNRLASINPNLRAYA